MSFFLAFMATMVGSVFASLAFLDTTSGSRGWTELLWPVVAALGITYIVWQYRIVSSLLTRGEEVRARVVSSRSALPLDFRHTWGTRVLLEYSHHGRAYRHRRTVAQQVEPGQDVILLVDLASPGRVILQRTLDSPDPRSRA